jgi:hypothetical protein
LGPLERADHSQWTTAVIHHLQNPLEINSVVCWVVYKRLGEFNFSLYRGSIPSKSKIFSSFQTCSGAHLSIGKLAALSTGVKWSGRVADPIHVVRKLRMFGSISPLIRLRGMVHMYFYLLLVEYNPNFRN